MTKKKLDAKEVLEIGKQMAKMGLSAGFIWSAVSTALEFEGVQDLLKLWKHEKDSNERDEIVADIQDMIDDCSQKEKINSVYVRFDDLEKIAKHNREFKDNLRLIVEKKGGIGKLASHSGIPQSSLSRFFNSDSKPRRTTLLKIAAALNLSQVEIATEWLR